MCRDASRVFLRDHLVRWAPRLGKCLEEAEGDPAYSAVGRLLGRFIVFDAGRELRFELKRLRRDPFQS